MRVHVLRTIDAGGDPSQRADSTGACDTVGQGGELMERAGLARFLAAEGVDDWVMLTSMRSDRLCSACHGSAKRPVLLRRSRSCAGLEGSGCSVDDRRCAVLSVRLARGVFRLESSAHRRQLRERAVSATARAHRCCARPDRRTGGQEVQDWSIAAKPDAVDARLLARCPRVHRRWTTTTPSTRSATARRSGCRNSTRPSRSGTRCTSTCPSLREHVEARLGGGPCRRRPHRRRRRCPWVLDPRRPRRQPRMHRCLARRVRPACSWLIGNSPLSE